MPPPIRPKLGNAASLFSDNPDGLSQQSIKKTPYKKRWAQSMAALGFICLAAAMFLIQNGQVSIKDITHTIIESNPLVESNISVVQANYQNDQLVGTLMHSESAENNDKVISSKPKDLTDKERDHLLNIISRQ